MSTLIYCQNQIAASPYYIEEASLNVYSLEEISYFILNNVYLLSNKFMSYDLCNWIGRELKEKKLSEDLSSLVQNNAPLHIFVGHILSSNGYSSQKEIKDTLNLVATFENKSEAERKKMRADRLMAADRIVDAIYEYESLLADDVTKTMSTVVEGDVYHNLGTAFARLFLFDQATRCFDEAYKRNKKKASLSQLLFTLKCKRDSQAFEDYIAKYQIPKEFVEEINRTVSDINGKAEITSFDKAINDLQFDENLDKFYDGVKDTISQWKKEYIKLCTI
ncbi:MAG: hypothetical protein K5773_00610 [Pseudobutyrivibrio sp.]|nr:hypothetical protein [Pseudobutyrivibrio sp.]